MSVGSSRRAGAPSVVRLLAVLVCASFTLAFVGAAAMAEVRRADLQRETILADAALAERLAQRLGPVLNRGESERAAGMVGALDDVAGHRVIVLDRDGAVAIDTAFDRRGEPVGLGSRGDTAGGQSVGPDGRITVWHPARYGAALVGEVQLVRAGVGESDPVWFWRDVALLLLVTLSITGIAAWAHHHRSLEITGLSEGLHRMLDGDRAELSPRFSAGEIALLHEGVRELDQVLARGEDRVAHSLVTMAIQMVDVLERRGQATPGHGERTARYCEVLADRMGLSPSERRDIDLAARLHELGKLWVRTSILTKSEELTTLERESFRQYPVRGADAFEGLPSLRRVASIIRHHRERYDGGGFPEGLRGDRIPLGARILTIAAAYDQLTSCNFQGEAVPWEEALVSMEEDRGVHFDPALLELFAEEIQSAPMPEQPDHPVLVGPDGGAPYKTGVERSGASARADEDLQILSIEELNLMFEDQDPSGSSDTDDEA